MGGWRERKRVNAREGGFKITQCSRGKMPSESRLRCLQDSHVDPTDSEGATHNISRGWQTCVSDFLPSVRVWHCSACHTAASAASAQRETRNVHMGMP